MRRFFSSSSLVSFTTLHEIVLLQVLYGRVLQGLGFKVSLHCAGASGDVHGHDSIHMCRLSSCFASALDPGPFRALGKHHSALLTLHKHFGPMRAFSEGDLT